MGFFKNLVSLPLLPFKAVEVVAHDLGHPSDLIKDAVDVVKMPFHILTNPLTAPLGIVTGALSLDPNKVWAAATGDTRRLPPEGGKEAPVDTATMWNDLTKERQTKYGALDPNASSTGASYEKDQVEASMAAARRGGTA